jgi:hypothetical protein
MTHDSTNNSLLSQKYTKLHNLINRMTTAMVSPRPTCEQILNERKLWSLNTAVARNCLGANKVQFEVF